MRRSLLCGPTEAAGEEPWAVVVIERPKNRRALGKVQHAAIRDSSATAWLMWIADACPLDENLWPRGSRALCHHFRHVIDLLGLRDMGLTLAGLRAGGTTHFHRCGVDP